MFDIDYRVGPPLQSHKRLAIAKAYFIARPYGPLILAATDGIEDPFLFAGIFLPPPS